MTDERRSDKVLGHFACRATQYRNPYPINIAVGQTSLSNHTNRDQCLSNFTDNYALNDFAIHSTAPRQLSGCNFVGGKRLKYGCLADSFRC